MPLRGGSSAKLGIRYEDRWTAKALLEVLREDAQEIRLEPPGPDGDGVEFYLRYDDRIEYHQVKRQRTGKGDWSIAALSQAGVLATFRDRLPDPSAHCRFVSAHTAASLEELSEHARSALSWREYQGSFLASKPLRAAYANLRSIWTGLDDEVVLAYLRRIHVTIVGEDALRRWAMTEARGVVDGDELTLLPSLVEIAQNNVNRLLTPRDLWNQLARYGYRPSIWTRPEQTAVLVDALNKRYIESRRATLIHGEAIPRSETTQLAQAVSSNRLVLLDGIAGMGKSDVLLQFVETLESAGTPYLVFRLDRTTPTRRKEDLGRELGLPTSPCTTLAAVAHGRVGFLIVDQLDAVSATSGRNPQFLECVADVVSSALALPNLRVVVVCRTFDVENDARLRQLVELEKAHATVTVGPLELAQLIEPLTRLGYPKGTLSDSQLELLRVPLHLALLAGVSAPGERSLTFSTSLDLHDAFWRSKHRELDARLGSSSWVQVVQTLVDYMSQQQVLRAPAALVDAWEQYVDAMVSSHVLTRDGRQLAFFHESFFDYSFARSFVGRQGSISSLLSQDQFLFRRGQVRQILAHERLSPGNEYRRDVAYLLQDPSVRFHVKDIVIAGLSQVVPNDYEWALIEPLLQDENSPLFGRAWLTLTSLDWFRHADGLGFVEARLRTEDALTTRMASILSMIGKSMPDRVAELLSPYADIPQWWPRIGMIAGQADLGGSRALFELFLRWIDGWGIEQVPPGVNPSSIFTIAAHELEKSRPDWCCELLARLIQTRSSLALQSGCENPFDHEAHVFPSGLHLEMLVGSVASKAPAAFMAHVWPTMQKLLEQNAVAREDMLSHDRIWGLRHFSEHVDFEKSLLYAAELAFRDAAQSTPDAFAALLDEHRNTNKETLIYLLYEGMRAAPERFAEAALQFVLSDVRRLRVGYSDSPYWGTRRLLEAVTPWASDESVARLERMLLNFYPERHGRPGRAQHALLGGIAEARRSRAVDGRIAELHRKFEGDGAPKGMTGGVVRSPISNESASKMNDEQWLKAIAKHAAGWRDRERGRDFLKGGAEELSRVLENEAKQAPTRFARLGLNLPDTSHPAYFDALLRGVADAAEQPPLEVVRALVERCHRLPGRPCGRWIARPLRRYEEDGIPAELLTIIVWYAINDPDPPDDRPPSDRTEGGLGLLNHGINTVRGGIASDLAALIEARSEYAASVEPAIRRLVTDNVTAVRASAAEVVCALVHTAPATAQSHFLLLITDTDDRLLTTHFVHQYLLSQGTDDFAMLRPVMERMLRSATPEVRKYGAIHMNLAALTREEARDAADPCLESDDDNLRLGAALVFASNLATPEHANRCNDALKQLFNDRAAEIRETAGTAFRRMESTQLGDHVDLAYSFLQSAAFEDNADDLVHALKETTAAVPELVLEACKRTLDAIEAKRGGPLMYQAGDALELLLRAYADGEDRSFKERTLDLVDRALRLDIYGMNKLLADHDRWWGTT